MTEGTPPNRVYSEKTPVEENADMHISPENPLPHDNNGQGSALTENSSGMMVRAAISDTQPSPLWQISNVPLQQRCFFCSGTLTPLARTFVLQNSANAFLSNPDHTRGTMHSYVNSEISLRYQTSASGEESLALQNKPSLVE